MALSGVQRCFQNVALIFVKLLADFHEVVDVVRGAVAEKVHEISLDVKDKSHISMTDDTQPCLGSLTFMSV